MAVDFNKGDTSLIVKECKKDGLSLEQAAYILATAWWETGRTMKPVKEAYWLSEGWRRDNLRYYPWYGRGYVQLTWQDNYKRAGQILGKNFITNPDIVMKPENSVEILVRGSMDGWFTGKKISDYIRTGKKDYRNARRVINGTDKAETIATLAVEYEGLLKANKYEGRAESWLLKLFKKIFGRKS